MQSAQQRLPTEAEDRGLTNLFFSLDFLSCKAFPGLFIQRCFHIIPLLLSVTLSSSCSIRASAPVRALGLNGESNLGSGDSKVPSDQVWETLGAVDFVIDGRYGGFILFPAQQSQQHAQGASRRDSFSSPPTLRGVITDNEKLNGPSQTASTCQPCLALASVGSLRRREKPFKLSAQRFAPSEADSLVVSRQFCSSLLFPCFPFPALRLGWPGRSPD